jgi:uncharacterized membrane protein
MFESIIYALGPIVFGLAGFLLAGYISIKKKKVQPLVCPLNGHCDAVVRSRYSRFLGLPVEYIGSLYYAFIAAAYWAKLVRPELFTDTITFFLVAITIGAFLFSVYLVSIQAFVLKKWCTWCLFSAGFSTFIFLFALFGAQIDLVSLLTEYKKVIVIFHALAAAIGVGSATLTDIFFFRFLKDYRISQSESDTMGVFSNVIWVALGVLILTGIGLYIQNAEVLKESSKFLVKVIAVAIVTVNGVLLNLYISPKLTAITFGEKHDHHSGELRFYRKIAFASGGVSIVTWYTIFILGSIRSIPVDFQTGLLVYLALLVLAVMGSQAYDNYLIRKKSKENPNTNTEN